MSAITERCHNHPSALQRPEPIADAFALLHDNPASPSISHQTMHRIHFDAWHLRTVSIRLNGTPATSNSSAALQIPIAT